MSVVPYIGPLVVLKIRENKKTNVNLAASFDIKLG